MPAWLYILRCADGSYYTGVVHQDLERRLAEHNEGSYGGFTSGRRPVTLAFSQEFERADEAIVMERRIKGWSRAKKEALMAGNWTRLRALARSSEN